MSDPNSGIRDRPKGGGSRSYSGVSHQQARPTQLLSVERSSVMPWRASICDCRYSGSESRIADQHMCHQRLGGAWCMDSAQKAISYQKVSEIYDFIIIIFTEHKDEKSRIFGATGVAVAL